ncbi:hypothetical protein DV736_g4203, partial [Chaetothyriales sp. CBS 134916]
MTSPLRTGANYLSFHDRALHSSDTNMDNSPIQPHIDTLFAEYARIRPSTSRSPSPTPPGLPQPAAPSLAIEDALARIGRAEEEPKVDLRALEYACDYDSHLMCPICHVPFVDPVVLDCDHTFCRACFEEYCDGATHADQSRCPTCRACLLATPHKASRLIINMCNDLRVCCPNEECKEVLPRGCIDKHVAQDCPETGLRCPDSACGKLVKRKTFVPGQCIHASHIECDCGAVIELGRGEWLKHRDEDCPTTGVKCELCDERISAKDYLAGRNAHVCKAEATTCPGAEYGCTDALNLDTMEEHTKVCPLARMAPYLQKQSRLLDSLSSQLQLTKVRNEVLEAGLDKLAAVVHDQILPSLPPRAATPSEHELDVEEIPRHPPTDIRPPGLSLPAHLRPLTPDAVPTSQELFALHNNLQDSIATLSNTLTGLQHSVTELDARTSMTMMNETLRLKEDLAHHSAGLFSTRAQVQWLLTRERERIMSMRARPEQALGMAGSAAPIIPAASVGSSVSGEGGIDSELGHGRSPTMPSPMVHPANRRLSGSQERVKL